MLRRIFGPKRDDIMEAQRKLPKEELCDLCSLPNITSDQVEEDGQGIWSIKLVFNLYSTNGRIIIMLVETNMMTAILAFGGKTR
jgi:hypothetical protein